jgi:uncharacterized membrane protein
MPPIEGGRDLTPLQRGEAQQHAEEIHAFRRELERLDAAGILRLDDGQREAITRHHEALLARYASDFDIDRGTGAKQLSLGMRVASFLGALALAASVFFLFYQFWGRFATGTQVAILVSSALASLALTFFIQARDAQGYFTKLAAMVAFACFVLDISMLGQVFNITPSDKALLPWAALAFILAYACELRLLLAAGILCLAAYIAARAGTWSGVYWIYFGARPENFFPAGVLFFAFPMLVDHRGYEGFAPTYRVFGLLALFLPMLVLSHWGSGSYLAMPGKFIEGFYQVLGFVLAAAAIFAGVRRHWNDVVNTGVAFFVIFLYTKLYDWWWDWMPKYLFFFLLGALSILLLLVMRRVRAQLSTRAAAA